MPTPSTPRYDAKQLAALGEQAQADGFVILRDHFPRATLQAWAEAFRPLLDDYLARLTGAEENRGPGRHYVTLPFRAPFADPAIYEDEAVLAVVEHLVGKDPVMVQLATDTPLLGSDYQDVHRDAPPLFPEWGQETPSFQLAVNFPLVDVTAERGPFEVARGTHRLSRDEGMALIESGKVKLEPVLLDLGDVMIRDVRGLHRGTPNRTETPRPMVVIGYSRRWMYRPEVHIRVPRAALASLSPRGKQLLRTNPVVESLEDAPAEESYRAFAY